VDNLLKSPDNFQTKNKNFILTFKNQACIRIFFYLPKYQLKMNYYVLNTFSTQNEKNNHIKVLTLPNINKMLISYINFCFSIEFYVNRK